LYGNSLSDWTTTDAITALAFREDGGWVNGSYFKPEGEDFCITQIPYSVSISLKKPQLVDEEEVEEEIDENIEDREEEIEEDSNGILDENNIVLIDSTTSNSDDFVGDGEVLGVQTNSVKDNNFVLPKTGVVIY